jgi:hypothetical protein
MFVKIDVLFVLPHQGPRVEVQILDFCSNTRLHTCRYEDKREQLSLESHCLCTCTRGQENTLLPPSARIASKRFHSSG